MYYALPMLLALGVVSNMIGGYNGKYYWTRAQDSRLGKRC